MKDYTVLLKAKIDPAGLDMSAVEKKIADINKKAYKIMLQVDTMGLKELESKFSELIKQAQIGKTPIRLIDAQHEIGMLDQIERKMQEIKNKQGNVSGYNISTTPGKAGEQDLTTATVKYTNAQKQSIIETYNWVNAAKAGEKADMVWALTKTKLTDNIKANEDAMNRAKQKASEYLEKIKSLNQSNANVIKGKSIAEQLIAETDPQKIQNLSKQLDVVKQSSQGARAGILSFTEGMKSSIMRTVEYSLSLGVLYGALNQIRQGIQYIKDLNKEMVNIQLVTGGSTEEIDSMALSYNNLAKEMGATTLDIAKGSLEFVRQGKTAEETAILIKNSTMMSKLGNMEAADATDKLTSIMNGFRLEAEETGMVIDKLVSLDNAYATSVNEIATAMKYGSNSAQQVGIDFDHLASYITVVSSTTRQSAETIGQAFKTMTSRYSDIRQGFDVGEGLDVNINNVEKALREVDIEIRDSNEEFRDMQDVISDLGKVWERLTPVMQANITKQFAGIRQKEMFLVLMNEQIKVEKALEIQQNSTNLAEERYQIYLKGVEAATNNLRASWEKLVMSSASADFIAGILNAGAGILDLVDSMGGLVTILKIVIPLMVIFNAALIKSTILGVVSTFSQITSVLGTMAVNYVLAGVAVEGFAVAEANAAAGAVALNIAALPFVATLAALTVGAGLYFNQLKNVRNEQEKIRTDLSNKTSNISSDASSYSDYVAKAKEAAKADGYVYDETGKMFKKGYHDLLVYVSGMDLLTEAQWNARNSAVALDKGERDDISALEGVGKAAEETAQSFEELKKQSFETLLENDSFDALLKQVVNMLKDIKKQEKENIQQQLSDYKDYIDNLKQGYKDRLDEEKRLYDEQKTNLQRQHEDEKRITDDRKDAIKDEFDGYKKILNARQELLKLQKAEAEYNRTRAEKESNLAKIEAQILEISFDTSAEGIAKRLELEQQATTLRQELATDASEHEYDLQQQALDAEIARAEEESAMRVKELEEEQKASDLRYEMRLRELEDAQDKSQQEYDTNIRNLENTYAAKEANFQNQIKLIDNYLSQEGLLNKEAMDLILDENSNVYKSLMDWNRVYGTGIENDIIAMWDLAKVAVDDYKRAIEGVSAIKVPTPFPNTGGFKPYEGEKVDPNRIISSHHTGIEKGAVGGKKLQSSEEFIRAVKGEVVITPKQMSNFTGNVLPSMINKPKGQSNFSGGATFDKLFDIVINGNLDKSTIPDLERLSTQIIDKINKGMQQRGMLRNTNLNAI